MLLYMYLCLMLRWHTYHAKAFSTTNFVTLYLILFYFTLPYSFRFNLIHCIIPEKFLVQFFNVVPFFRVIVITIL